MKLKSTQIQLRKKGRKEELIKPRETLIGTTANDDHDGSVVGTKISTEPTTITTASNVDDATYMLNSFSGLLEGDLYDDELNGK